MDSGEINLFLAVIMCFAVYLDIKYRKIPNWLTFSSISVGLAHNGFIAGWPGFLFSITGLGMGLFLLITFYFLGGMGAGDVKLMGAVGAFLGVTGVLYSFLFTAIFGGIYAGYTLIKLRGQNITLKIDVTILKNLLVTRQFSYILPRENNERLKIPYGVVIALGTLAVILLKNISIIGGLR
jgi:prepilin peptidase CpaA